MNDSPQLCCRCMQAWVEDRACSPLLLCSQLRITCVTDEQWRPQVDWLVQSSKMWELCQDTPLSSDASFLAFVRYALDVQVGLLLESLSKLRCLHMTICAGSHCGTTSLSRGAKMLPCDVSTDEGGCDAPAAVVLCLSSWPAFPQQLACAGLHSLQHLERLSVEFECRQAAS